MTYIRRCRHTNYTCTFITDGDIHIEICYIFKKNKTIEVDILLSNRISSVLPSELDVYCRHRGYEFKIKIYFRFFDGFFNGFARYLLVFSKTLAYILYNRRENPNVFRNGVRYTSRTTRSRATCWIRLHFPTDWMITQKKCEN